MTWNAPITSRLLFEAGVSRADGSWPTYRQPEVTHNDISILEQSTGCGTTRASPTSPTQGVPRISERFSASYVTGSHAAKAGFQLEQIYYRLGFEAGTNNVDYVFSNGVPVSLNQWATPYEQSAQNYDFGFFAQDQWSIRRLTFTYGLRYEYHKGYVPAQNVAATPNGWVPARTFGEVNNVPLWKDLDSARRRGVRPLRQRTDGAEGGHRAIRVEGVGRDDHHSKQSDPDVNQFGQPHLGRHERQLHPGLRPGEPGAEW